MNVPEWEDPRRVLARHGLNAKRRFSQNFLTSRSAIESIARALSLKANEPVVELGPGVGTLTAALLREGARVIAIEADHDMIDVLSAELGNQERLRVEHGDATTIDLKALSPRPVAVAGNLPYAITGAIFRQLVDQYPQVDRAVVMVQREVRDRLLSAPGRKQYGALTVFTSAVFEVAPVCLVPAGAFHPAPKVDSAVIALSRRAEPVDPARPTFSRAVRAAFEARRKTLRNALQRSFPIDHVDAGLAGAGIDGNRRGETLSVREFDALARALTG